MTTNAEYEMPEGYIPDRPPKDHDLGARAMDRDVHYAKCNGSLCPCGAPAIAQALYRHVDGSHFLGGAYCAAHQVPLGAPRYAGYATVIDHIALPPTDGSEAS